jgi:hypothetical protein
MSVDKEKSLKQIQLRGLRFGHIETHGFVFPSGFSYDPIPAWLCPVTATDTPINVTRLEPR